MNVTFRSNLTKRSTWTLNLERESLVPSLTFRGHAYYTLISFIPTSSNTFRRGTSLLALSAKGKVKKIAWCGDNVIMQDLGYPTCHQGATSSNRCPLPTRCAWKTACILVRSIRVALDRSKRITSLHRSSVSLAIGLGNFAPSLSIYSMLDDSPNIEVS